MTVERANLALEVGRLMCGFGRELLHHVVEPRFGKIRHSPSRTNGGFIGGNLRAVEPGAIRKAEEIVAGPGDAILSREVESPRAVHRFWRARRSSASYPQQSTCHCYSAIALHPLVH